MSELLEAARNMLNLHRNYYRKGECTGYGQHKPDRGDDCVYCAMHFAIQNEEKRLKAREPVYRHPDGDCDTPSCSCHDADVAYDMLPDTKEL